MSEKEVERITVVVPSLKTKEEGEPYVKMLEDTAGVPLDVRFIHENKEGLTSLYQRELEDSPNDFIVFMHDDLEFFRNDWGKTLIKLFKTNRKFGIIGLAGSKHFGYKNDMRWWSSDPTVKYGMVFHGDEKKSWITMFSDYNLRSDLTEVAVIDGLFIACNRNVLQYNFDDEIPGFHFYDIDFCLANLLSRRCKIGVTDRICVRHNSPGKINDSWIKNSEMVFEKYKDNLPIKVL